MSTDDFAIELTGEEQNLLDQIEFDVRAASDPQAVRRDGKLASELIRRLTERDRAIPAYRLHNFTDPKYHIGGRGSSRQQIFERNERSGSGIIQHRNRQPPPRFLGLNLPVLRGTWKAEYFSGNNHTS